MNQRRTSLQYKLLKPAVGDDVEDNAYSKSNESRRDSFCSLTTWASRSRYIATVVVSLGSIVASGWSIGIDPCFHLLPEDTQALYFSSWGITIGAALGQMARYYHQYHNVYLGKLHRKDKQKKPLGAPDSLELHSSFDVHTCFQMCMFLTMCAAYSWPLFFLRMKLDSYMFLVTWVIVFAWLVFSALTYLDKHVNEDDDAHAKGGRTTSVAKGCKACCKEEDFVPYLYAFLDFCAIVGVVLYVVAYHRMWADFAELMEAGIMSNRCRLLYL